MYKICWYAYNLKHMIIYVANMIYELVYFESSVLGIVLEYDELVSEYGELVLPEYGGVAPGYGETGNMFTGCGWDIW